VKSPAPPRDYPDLHDHLRALDEAGLLMTVDIPINKDTEIHPLMRWQFQGGIAEADRKAMLFTNVVDSNGKSYDIPVLIGGMAANREVYRIGIGCALDQVTDTWFRAMNEPIPPRVVDHAPCHDIIIEGEELDKPGNGLDGLPVPISTPGWDNAPYFSTSSFITRDPETGQQNMGVYRAQVKAPRRMGMNTSVELRTGGFVHWSKYKERGERMPAAVVVGAPPAVSFAAVQKAPENLDELALAGGLVGAPINVVPARTVDLMVPAEAEIVIEGFVDTEYLELEAPFGESHGHVNLQEYNGFMEITCITRRHDAVLTAFLSQVTPSESSVLRRPGQEYVFLRHLREQLGIKGVIKVSMHIPLTGGYRTLIVQFERGVPTTEIWRALYGLATTMRAAGKIIIATNDDIDPDNADAVLWALAYRSKPHLDMQILPHQGEGHGPRDTVRDDEDSSLLIDATLKQDYPPIALPKQEFMENARRIWEDRLGQPKLKPESPWYGYSLGAWTDELEEQARRAVTGDYWETGRRTAQRRRSDVAMNTEARMVPEQTDDI
jgi:4-hydroxy-3-polyprenylbenzoate decarboxylase